MNMLGQDIIEFIEQVTELKAIGCIRVPLKDRASLVELLDKADIIVARTPALGRATFHVMERIDDLSTVKPPAIIVITEEDYRDPRFAERVRFAASYFLRVKN